MKVAVFGAHGAQGSYLCEYIRAAHPDVELLTPGRSSVDLRDEGIVEGYLGGFMPDRIFHLASEAILPESFHDPLHYIHNNIMGTANLFEAVRQTCPKARVLLASSCEVYGAPQYMPMDEAHPFNPLSPYAVSKAAQDHMARMYAKVYGLHIVVSRLFNLINPRREDLFASAFAKQIALIEAGKQEELRVGNLDSERTLLDVRDVVRGYWLLLERGTPGEAYNFGDCEAVSVRDVLRILTSMARCKIGVRQDMTLFRPVDIRTQVADSRKFLEATGWQPQYTVPESLKWLLDTMREKYGNG